MGYEIIKLKPFYRATKYCDINHPEIQKVAKSFLAKYHDRKELAIALFRFARDQIKYCLGPWNKKASTTLAERSGMCTSSTNLLVALYRAVGIPAGYYIYKVRGGESFGHIIPSYIKRGINKKPSVHVVCGVNLNNKWIKCDPATDIELSNKSKHISELTELNEWNGEIDAVHKLDKKSIIDIRGPLANIDFQLEKKPRYIVKKHIFQIGNSYIYFLRNWGDTIYSHKELDYKFSNWLKKNNIIKYYNYKLIYFILNNSHNIIVVLKKIVNKIDSKYKETYIHSLLKK